MRDHIIPFVKAYTLELIFITIGLIVSCFLLNTMPVFWMAGIFVFVIVFVAILPIIGAKSETTAGILLMLLVLFLFAMPAFLFFLFGWLTALLCGAIALSICLPRVLRRKKTASQIGTEVALLVQQQQRGLVGRDRYAKRMVDLVSEFAAAANSMRFLLEDVDVLVACGEQLDEECRFLFFDDFRRALAALSSKEPVTLYALHIVAIQTYTLALRRASRLNAEQRWAESLAYCELAEQAFLQFEDIGPLSMLEKSQLYAIFGETLAGLQRSADAYGMFLRACSLAREMLTRTDQKNMSNEIRKQLETIAAVSEQEIKRLEVYLKE